MVMVRAHSVPAGDDAHPPVILVHGAANSGRVWTFRQDELARRGWSSHAIDLRGHGASVPAELATTHRADYADDVMALARSLRQPPILIGWSMGGLVAMMAAGACLARACVGLAPSVPTRAWDSSVRLRTVSSARGIRDRRPRSRPSAVDARPRS